jgi:hypothetical protein
LSYFDPSDIYGINVKGNQENLLLHIDTNIMKNINDLAPVFTDSFYNKASHAKFDYETLSLYFSFLPHDVIQNTLKQTTQLVSLQSIIPCEPILKVVIKF